MAVSAARAISIIAATGVPGPGVPAASVPASRNGDRRRDDRRRHRGAKRGCQGGDAGGQVPNECVTGNGACSDGLVEGLDELIERLHLLRRPGASGGAKKWLELLIELLSDGISNTAVTRTGLED